MYVEIEKHEVVQEELMKGMDQKNPKVVAACISALNTALKQFGNKVITIKPMVKKIPVLLADRDKGVRDEMKALVAEMHRFVWIVVVNCTLLKSHGYPKEQSNSLLVLLFQYNFLFIYLGRIFN